METKNPGQEQQGGSGQPTASKAGFSGQFDSRYNEDQHLIVDRLRSMGSNIDNVLVIGQKADGTAFAWSTGDEQRTQELAKSAAPVLAGLEA